MLTTALRRRATPSPSGRSQPGPVAVGPLAPVDPVAARWAEPLAIGPWRIGNRALVAPMAGVTDRPFRQLCRRLGATYAVSEMAAANPALRDSVKTTRRLDHRGEAEPRAVQIAGADPAMMADAARYNVDRGAQVIDINMGCPARKVCNVAAGSALMADEARALAIIDAVVAAVDVPVTLKMRTGTDPQHRTAARLARAAEQAGVQMITVHGRSRACRFTGPVDLEAIAEVRAAITIPLVANGDIASPARARQVFVATGADAIMVGRAAQGRPWIFRRIDAWIRDGRQEPAPTLTQIGRWLHEHLLDHYAFYGEYTGVRTARKHIGWYLDALAADHDGPDRGAIARLRAAVNLTESTREQLDLVESFFDHGERVDCTRRTPEGACR